MDEHESTQENFPIRCDCGCTETEYFDEYYEGFIRLEYKVRCKKCGRLLGCWAYRDWETSFIIVTGKHPSLS